MRWSFCIRLRAARLRLEKRGTSLGTISRRRPISRVRTRTVSQSRVASVGQWMSVSHNRRIGAQLLAIFQTVVDGRANDGVIQFLYGGRTQPVERLVERIVLGNQLAVEAGELPQRVSIIDTFAQFAVIPILDAHQDQRPQNLAGG